MKAKRFILIILIGILTIGFSNAVGAYNPVIRFITLSVLSIISGIILKPIKVKSSILKLVAFISFFLVFFIYQNIFEGFAEHILYNLTYLSFIIIFYLLGNSFNFKNKRRLSVIVVIITILIISSEIFFIPEMLYSNKFVKIETDTIPDFELEDLNGNTVTREDFKGKVVFFDFWTTTCGYCIAQFPSIYKVANQFKDNPDVLFCLIDYNGKFDDTEYVKKFVKERNIQLPVLIDKKSELSKKLNCFTFPHSFILDKDLKIRYHHTGYQKEAENIYIKDVTNRIKKLLNE